MGVAPQSRLCLLLADDPQEVDLELGRGLKGQEMGQENLWEPERRKGKMGQLEKRGVKTGQVEMREQEMETKILRWEDLWQLREMVQAWKAFSVS